MLKVDFKKYASALVLLWVGCLSAANGQTDAEQIKLNAFQVEKDIVFKEVAGNTLDFDYFKPQNLKAVLGW